jgi:hypothetical protein
VAERNILFSISVPTTFPLNDSLLNNKILKISKPHVFSQMPVLKTLRFCENFFKKILKNCWFFFFVLCVCSRRFPVSLAFSRTSSFSEVF